MTNAGLSWGKKWALKGSLALGGGFYLCMCGKETERGGRYSCFCAIALAALHGIPVISEIYER